MTPFHFDAARARRAIVDPYGAIWPVNDFCDADELNDLFEAAVQSKIIRSRNRGGFIHVYPHSIAEPDPILAVRLGSRAWLGQGLKLRERDGESPLDFTLRLLEETTIEANGLLHSNERSCRPSVEPDEALWRFIEATRTLNEALTPTIQVEGYPSYLPSFDQFAVDVESMRFDGSAENSC